MATLNRFLFLVTATIPTVMTMTMTTIAPTASDDRTITVSSTTTRQSHMADSTRGQTGCSQDPTVTLAACIAISIMQRSGVCPSVRLSVPSIFKIIFMQAYRKKTESLQQHIRNIWTQWRREYLVRRASQNSA